MNAWQYFQICRAILPLAAASMLSACGFDFQSVGEPFFNLAERDASVLDAAADSAPASAQNAADGGTADRDAGTTTGVEDSDDAGS